MVGLIFCHRLCGKLTIEDFSNDDSESRDALASETGRAEDKSDDDDEERQEGDRRIVPAVGITSELGIDGIEEIADHDVAVNAMAAMQNPTTYIAKESVEAVRADATVAELNGIALVAVQNTGEVDVTAVTVKHLIDNNVSTRGLPLA